MDADETKPRGSGKLYAWVVLLAAFLCFGVVFGTLLVPGLYVVFATLAEGRKLIRDEEEAPLSEEVVHHG